MMFRTMTNGDLYDFLRSFCGFLPHESQEKWPPIYVNATECNTLPVLYNINSSTVILSEHQIIYTYMFQHKAIQWAQNEAAPKIDVIVMNATIVMWWCTYLQYVQYMCVQLGKSVYCNNL